MNFQEIEATVSKVKALYDTYFADKTIPLEERWHTFVLAPEYLKNDLGSMATKLGDYFGNDVVMYDGLFHTDRHARYSTADVVESLEDGTEYMDVPIEVIKEKILAENFGFFTYDW